MPAKPLYIGLMSGTSLDSIDAVLVELDSAIQLQQAITHPLPSELRDDLLRLCTEGEHEIARMLDADVRLGHVFADAVESLLKASGRKAHEIRAIGSHGQTIRHLPDAKQATTLQIGDANIIAERCGITTVADFRRRDMAAGGQGAPLVPAFHQALFASDAEERVIINIGGIANITRLPCSDEKPSGFDTGPGNVLMDGWIAQQQGQLYDENGSWAASGQPNETLLEAMLQDHYFHRPVPKSTGREHFNTQWLQGMPITGISPEDVQASLCELTARSIANAIKSHAPRAKRLLVCGGGAANRHLLQRLAAHFDEIKPESTERYGIHPDWVEGAAFAWLAQRCLDGMSGNLPEVTGAQHPVILGAIYQA